MLSGVRMVPGEVPGRRWFKSMDILDSLLWDRLEMEPPSFRRELRDADKPSPSGRREDGEERGGWFKRKRAFWEVIRDAKSCSRELKMCLYTCLGMGNRKETRKKAELKEIQNIVGTKKYAMQGQGQNIAVKMMITQCIMGKNQISKPLSVQE